MGGMKKLLDKSLKPIAVYALLVLLLSIPTYFVIIDFIWERELDKHHYAIRQKLQQRINTMHLPDSSVQKTIDMLNHIQPGFSFTEDTVHPLQDSLYTIIRYDAFMQDREQFRSLRTHVTVNRRLFRLLIETNMEEIDETIIVLSAMTFFFLGLLLGGFVWLNRRSSIRIWKPFYETLGKLKSFRLESETPLVFSASEIYEFNELNGRLADLTQTVVATYRTQREFTQNASHELQTPLAIIKSKVDILLQDELLTSNQMEAFEQVNHAVGKVMHINKNLLLLAKIENGFFDRQSGHVELRNAINELLEQFADFASEKHIEISHWMPERVSLEANSALTDILLGNLLINAVRYTAEHGSVSITLEDYRISIANTGQQPLPDGKLFKRFSQVSESLIGSGLGLAIAKQVCIYHGWVIDYQYRKGQHVFSILFR